MFLAIFLSIWALLHLYVFWRVATIPLITQRVSPWALAGVAVALWASYPMARVLFRWKWIGLGRIVEWIGATWLGVLLLLFSMLLLADVVSILLGAGSWVAHGLGNERVHRLLASRDPALRLGAMGVACVLSLVAVVQALRPPVERDYEVRLAKLPRNLDGTVVVEISDLHLGTLVGSGWAAEVVRRVNALNPDLIVLAGDIVEGHAEFQAKKFTEVLRKLRAPLGVWAVTGNHDHYSGTAGSVQFLEDTGCRLLMNRWVEAAPGLVLAGTDGRHSHGLGDPDEQEARLTSDALAGRPSGAATILVSHYPHLSIADAASSAGVGLMLSGHTHGGQIWPFSYVTHNMFPLFAGRYDVAGTTVIVCRGTGTWGPRMRLWRPSEIVHIVLKSGT